MLNILNDQPICQGELATGQLVRLLAIGCTVHSRSLGTLVAAPGEAPWCKDLLQWRRLRAYTERVRARVEKNNF